MSLEPVEGELGLWREPSAKPGDPGLHAFIAGVSDYPFLPGGSRYNNAVPSIPGMNQLVVSASGAAQVFEWLRAWERFFERPVLSVRLLLAPGTAAPTVGGVKSGMTEAQFVQSITDGHHAEPTYKNLEQMIQDWANEFFKTPAAVRSQSAGLFFFSGHGLNVASSPSLVASDILDTTRGQGFNNAVAYKSILDNLPSYGPGDAIFMFDCCQNAPDPAKVVNIQGRSVLDPLPNPAAAPRSMMWLKAADQNNRAYQDPNSERRASLFGQAILEGLEGFPPDNQPYDCAKQPWTMMFGQLESFAKERVRVLLQAQNSLKVQTVTASGDPYEGDLVIAEMEPPVAMGLKPGPGPAPAPYIEFHDLGIEQASDEGPATGAAEPGEDYEFEADGDDGDDGAAASAPSTPRRRPGQKFIVSDRGRYAGRKVDDRAGQFLSNFEHSREDLSGMVPQAGKSGLLDWNIMHEALGHEFFTDGWIDAVSLQDLDGAPITDTSVQIIGGRSSQKAGVAWIDLLVGPGLGAGVFVALNRRGGLGPGPAMPASLGVLLPRDKEWNVPVRLECAFSEEEADGRRAPMSLSARLGPPQQGGVSDMIWGGLWRAQQAGLLYSVARAQESIPDEAGPLRQAIIEKRSSPLAAAIGAAALLQQGAIGRVHDWPRNLANWFEAVSDGPILWAETVLRRQRAGLPLPADVLDSTNEAARWFSEVNIRGAPRLGPVMSFAIDQAQRLKGQLDSIMPDHRDGVVSAAEIVLSAAADVDPDSFFLAFRSGDDTISAPAEYRGRPEAVLAEAEV